ncbi:MAG: Crp/Fnr family transcriptional regulator [Saprospiraceae bacterium]
MADQSFWYLENIDLMGVFCPQKVDGEQMEAKEKGHFKSGTYVYLPDEPAKNVYLISKGRIKIGTYGEEGREITKAILGPGEVFGEMALIGIDERRDFAYALEDTAVCVLESTDMTGMLRERNDLQMFIMRLIGKRTLALERRLESLVFKKSRTRIVEFLYELAEEKGRPVGYEREVKNMLTHKEVADLTATSRQSVNSVMNELRTRNIISFNRRRLLVRDMDKLKEEIESEAGISK